MILLPNNCNCGYPSVFPKDWETCKPSALKLNWRIQYYFRDLRHKDKYPKGKLVRIKGMNHFKTLAERREAVQSLIDNELYMLKVEGYNPITQTFDGANLVEEMEIYPDTLICQAIEYAFTKIEGADSTLSDLKTVKKYFIASTKDLGLHILKIEDVRRKHVKKILDNQSNLNDYSNDRFNKVRAYMQMIFNELLDLEVVDYNPVSSIKLKKTTKKLKQVLTDTEVTKIKKHLKQHYYTFYRYTEIFFHSGCRSSELMRVKAHDVNLKNQTFKVLIKKGKSYEEQLRAININVLSLWKELVSKATPNDFIFSKFLEPGQKQISEWQISKRWREHVKIKLNITADFYSLKHLHTTKIVSAYDEALAASVNGHKSTKMNQKHYDILHKKRLLEAAKSINVSL